MNDVFAIACNFRIPTKTATKNTKAWMTFFTSGGTLDGGRIHLLYRSRGGRTIRKHEAIKNLCNVRVKTLPPEHPLYKSDVFTFTTQEAAAERAEYISRACYIDV